MAGIIKAFYPLKGLARFFLFLILNKGLQYEMKCLLLAFLQEKSLNMFKKKIRVLIIFAP